MSRQSVRRPECPASWYLADTAKYVRSIGSESGITGSRNSGFYPDYGDAIRCRNPKISPNSEAFRVPKQWITRTLRWPTQTRWPHESATEGRSMAGSAIRQWSRPTCGRRLEFAGFSELGVEGQGFWMDERADFRSKKPRHLVRGNESNKQSRRIAWRFSNCTANEQGRVVYSVPTR